ncbi:MAG: PorV/PorQ family protein [Elusimicrobia bacterium]|nr:PorV/PorQ family protein [Elusimicrobiota bacterium]
MMNDENKIGENQKDKRSILFLVFFISSFILHPSSLFAEAGRTAAAFLKRPLGARASAMGQAYVAMEGDVNSLGYNPAALATLSGPVLSTMYSTGLTDDGFGFLSYGHPTSWGTLSAGLIYFNGGNIELNLSSGLREYRMAEEDTVWMGGYALRLAPGFFVGVVGKWIQLKLVQEFTAKSQAVDGGLLWETPLKGLSLGGSLQNVGKEVRFEQEGDPLPKTWRGGAAYRIYLGRFLNEDPMAQTFKPVDKQGLGGSESFELILVADGVQVLRERTQAHLGMEVRKIPVASEEAYANLRIGYIFNRDIDSLSFGVGFEWRQLLLDYGFSLIKDLNSLHRVSIGFKF